MKQVNALLLGVLLVGVIGSSLFAKPLDVSTVLDVKDYHGCMDNGGYHEDCWGK